MHVMTILQLTLKDEVLFKCSFAGREFQISEAATLKLRSSNEVLTNGRESTLVFDNLRER